MQPEFLARGAEDYISGLQAAVIQSRAHLPALTQSAERAANEFLAGGNLWVAGRQADFVAEACERAGGLMAMARLGDHVPAKHDVILYAVPGLLEEHDRKMIEEWRGKGAMVITFSSEAGLFRNRFPVDTVVNVIELWMWTGEFAAACTRSGKMPVFYQSYGLPGGYERAKKYQGKRFHDDLSIRGLEEKLGEREDSHLSPALSPRGGEGEGSSPHPTLSPNGGEGEELAGERSSRSDIAGRTNAFSKTSMRPIAAGVLGNDYLDQIQQMLARLREREMPKVDRAAEWWSKAKSATALVTGHMFPAHGQDARARQVCDFVRAPAREDKALLGANPPEFVLYLGYQFAPQKLLDEAKTAGVRLVYSDVQPGQPVEPSENILYIAPGWPLSDGCVSVPGYDVAILPSSGVAQAAIYWTMAAKAFGEGRRTVLNHKN